MLVRFAQVVREKPYKGMGIISKAYAEYNEALEALETEIQVWSSCEHFQ